MAKTSKTTKRTSATSGKKKGILGRSFNLKSRKVQFFVSILVIAIVGAGYFTIKSFAASLSYSFTGPQLGSSFNPSGGGTALLGSANLGTKPSCNAKVGTDAGKNGMAVMGASCDGSGSLSLYTPAQPIADNNANGSWRACFVAKGSGGDMLIQAWEDAPIFATTGHTWFVQPTRITNFNSSGYTTVCSDWGSYHTGTVKGLKITPVLVFNKGIINVSTITLERQDGGTGTFPTPTK